jgi:hypothetical protein
MADYHLLQEETGSPSFVSKLEETSVFLIFKLIRLILLSIRPDSKAQVSINDSFLKIKASVLMERPGVHVQSRVAVAAAMITLHMSSKFLRNQHPKESI